MKLDTKEFESRMNKSIDVFKENLSTIRAGRANTAVVSKVTVDYYGVATAITQMAEVKVADPKTLTIQPWDASTVKAIEKAILASDIGITPVNDGKILRLTFPQLTEERRKELKKSIAKLSEEAKVAVRNIRRDANDAIKKMEKAGEISEDDLEQGEDKIQKMTDKMIAKIDKAVEEKTKEIMTV